jgi:DNA polymerase-3 subunit gamma/tau
MSYQALYRKYRSQRFDEMVGQEVVARTLKKRYYHGTDFHAYLFQGHVAQGKHRPRKFCQGD